MDDRRLIDYANGSYSTSDMGCRGDEFALVPRMYPVPEYLTVYDELRRAMDVAVDTCALQQGVCWVIARNKVAPSCGNCGPCDGMKGFDASRSAVKRRYRTASTIIGANAWRPIAAVTARGVAAVRDGCVLPFWQRIFFNTDADHFTRGTSSSTYQAAVRAAMVIADREKRPRVICAECQSNGKVVPLTYVHPGGVVRSAPAWATGPTTVERMDRFEFDAYRMASKGASIMPFNM